MTSHSKYPVHESERLYREMLERWLKVRRDMPGLEGIEPEIQVDGINLDWHTRHCLKQKANHIRASVVREFERVA